MGWALTLLFWVEITVLFRADSFATADVFWRAMHDLSGVFALPDVEELMLVIAAGVVAIAGPTSQNIAFDRLVPNRWYAVAAGLLITVVLVLVGGGGEEEFYLLPVLTTASSRPAPAMLDRRSRSAAMQKDQASPRQRIPGVSFLRRPESSAPSRTSAVLYLVVLIVDPYDSVPFSPGWERYPVTSQSRPYNIKLARRGRFDSAVIGNSTSMLLHPKRPR